MLAKPKLVVVLGATASGKTQLAINLAKRYNAEIFSADSRQFYKELNIGVAKPNNLELQEAKHHFIGHISINQNYSAGDFERDCIAALNQYFTQKNIAILVGGSGLFIKAVLEGLDDFPKIDNELRLKLNEELQANGLQSLLEKLKDKDFETYSTISLENPRRVIRALEIIEQSGRPFSSFKKQNKEARNFTTLKLCINLDRKTLYDRINQRVDAMMSNGLEQEAKELLPFKNLNALNTVGYSEIFAYLNGEISKQRAVDLIKQHTRNYAKRQLTWFRNEENLLQINTPILESELVKIDAMINA